MFVASPVLRTESRLADEVTVRTIRQQRLTSAEDPLELVAIMDEPVLHRPVGGPDVLRAQLAHLAAAAELDSVTLQVLSTAGGAHVTMGSGFIVLSFGDLGEPDTAYVEHALGALFLEKEPTCRELDSRSTGCGPTRSSPGVPSPAESLALIRRVAEQT